MWRGWFCYQHSFKISYYGALSGVFRIIQKSRFLITESPPKLTKLKLMLDNLYFGSEKENFWVSKRKSGEEKESRKLKYEKLLNLNEKYVQL